MIDEFESKDASGNKYEDQVRDLPALVKSSPIRSHGIYLADWRRRGLRFDIVFLPVFH